MNGRRGLVMRRERETMKWIKQRIVAAYLPNSLAAPVGNPSVIGGRSPSTAPLPPTGNPLKGFACDESSAVPPAPPNVVGRGAPSSAQSRATCVAGR